MAVFQGLPLGFVASSRLTGFDGQIFRARGKGLSDLLIELAARVGCVFLGLVLGTGRVIVGYPFLAAGFFGEFLILRFLDGVLLVFCGALGAVVFQTPRFVVKVSPFLQVRIIVVRVVALSCFWVNTINDNMQVLMGFIAMRGEQGFMPTKAENL